MANEWQKEKLFFYLRWMIFFLVFCLVLLLFKEKPQLLKVKEELMYLGIASLIYLTLSTIFWNKIEVSLYHYLSWLIDLVIVTLLILLTFKNSSPFCYLFFYLILVGGLGRTRAVSLATTSIIALLYLSICLLEFQQPSGGKMAYAPSIFRLALFFVTGFLIGRPNESSKVNLADAKIDKDQLLEEQYNRSRALVKEMEKKTHELYDKTRKMETMLSLARMMSSTRNLDALLELITTQAREWMNVRISFLLLVRGECLELVNNQGFSEISQKIFSVKVGEGIFGEVAASGRPIRLSENDHDPRWQTLAESREKIRNLLCVPLKTKMEQKPVGILGVANLLVGEAFTAEQEDYLMILATDAVIAYENASLIDQLERSYLELIQVLAQAVEAKDPYTHGHIDRVRWLSVNLARAMKMSEKDQDVIAKAAILHDVGKIGTPDQILLKAGALTDEERTIMNDHASASYRILKDIHSLDERVKQMVLHHHERYDGKGYPDQLIGEDIPLGAQIIAVADTFDAMTSDRPYRKGFDPDEAIAKMQQFGPGQFSPRVLTAFFSLYATELKQVWKKEGTPQYAKTLSDELRKSL